MTATTATPTAPQPSPLIKTLLATVLAMAVCVALLAAVACIPRGAIQRQSEVSAEYFAEREPFAVLIGDYVNSIQDNYSDTLLCNIAYCLDPAHPLTSAIRAKYVAGSTGEARDGYLEAVRGESEPGAEYGRYWHGSLVLVRPLLMLMPIQGIRVLVGAAALLIQLTLMVALWRRGLRAEVVCYGLALLLVHPWMFFVSLENGTAFLAASVAELVLWTRLKDAPDERLLPFFAAVGVATFFVDFLTTETMTFTLPMLLVLLWRSREEVQAGGAAKASVKASSKASAKQSARRSALQSSGASVKDGCASVVKCGASWLFGYAAMFALKLLLLTIVAGEAVVQSSLAEGFVRVGGQVWESNFTAAPEVGGAGRLSGAIWHNLACLFPVQTGRIDAAGAWLPSLFILGAGLVAVYLLNDGIDWRRFAPLGLLALVPYLRFLVLSNHAYIHFFFTYRAQMVSLAVFALFVWENGLQHLRGLFGRALPAPAGR